LAHGEFTNGHIWLLLLSFGKTCVSFALSSMSLLE